MAPSSSMHGLAPRPTQPPRPPGTPPGIRRTVDAAGTSWFPILAAYGVYVLLALLNDATQVRQLLSVGGAFFLAVLAGCAARHPGPIRFSSLTLAWLACALVPLLAWMTGSLAPVPVAKVYTVKYFSLLFVVGAAKALRLPPLYRTRERKWVLALLAGVMLLGALKGGSSERIDGIFTNPNNFALAALGLLFLVDHGRDDRRFIAGMHALALGLILFSGTAGAVLGYLAGGGLFLLRKRWGRQTVLLGAVAAGLLLLLPGLLPKDQASALADVPMIGPVWTKWTLTRDSYADLAAGTDPDFGRMAQEQGDGGLTSGIWRLWHWRETYRTFDQSGATSRLFGLGLGSSAVLQGKLPHNDYLRLLFEVGYLGLAAQLSLWLLLCRRIPPADQCVALMVAAFSFTENNLDNFLVMGLFALFVASAGHLPSRPTPPEAAP